MTRKPASSPRTLTLEGDLDVFSIHHQWEQVQPLLTMDGGTIHLDLSGIGDLDLSGIQLLCALERDLSARHIPFSLTGTKEEWKPRFEVLGMAHLFAKDTP